MAKVEYLINNKYLKIYLQSPLNHFSNESDFLKVSVARQFAILFMIAL